LAGQSSGSVASRTCGRKSRSRDSAWAGVWPGASRPKTVSHQLLRRSSALSLPRMIGSVPSGAAMSKARPICMPRKSRCETPTIVNAWPSR
jgi:hypothetical protein